MVTHIMSPMLSRFTIVFYLVIFKRLEQRVQVPSIEKQRQMRVDSISQLLDLKSECGTKITRDIFTCIVNFLCPNMYAKLTVPDALARQFHHTGRMHKERYSSSKFSRDENGNKIDQSIELATAWHRALGEPTIESDVQQAQTVQRDPSNAELNSVAASLYSNPAASVTGIQNRSVKHILMQDRHLIIKSGCGTGKSGVYILPLFYARCYGVRPKKILVISPYNALLSQHVQQARSYFRNVNLSVEGLVSADVGSLERSRFDSDLTFISIEAFKLLKETHRDILTRSSFDVCVIDEVHNVFEETFRLRTWASLKLISSYGWKLVAMSATLNSFVIKKLASYLGISERFDTVGCREYWIPDIAIRHVRVPREGLLKKVFEFVKQRVYYDATSKTVHKCHIVTATKDDANSIQSLLSEKDIKAAVLTSQTNQEDRELIMERWGNDPTLTVLASTFVDGIDSRFTQTVVIMNHAGSVMRAIQAIGRIRPPMQQGRRSVVCYFDTGFVPGDNEGDTKRKQLILESMICTPDESEEGKELARREISNVLQKQGLDLVFNGNDNEGCLRRDLLSLIDVNSPPCGMCSKCDVHNHVAVAAHCANEQLLKQGQIKEKVISRLVDMSTTCPGCLSRDCNGFHCIDLGAGNSNVCIKCHGVHVSGHACIAKYVNVTKNACPYCFLPFHKDIDGTGGELHKAGECIHKDRIRHVLLLDLRGSNDNGQKAHDRLVTCSANHDEWFATMERNLRKMKDDEISKAVDSSFHDDELMNVDLKTTTYYKG